MRAVVRERYGGPERISVADVPAPDALAPGRVLVRVRASSVNALDLHELRGEPMPMRLAGGLRRPKDRRLGTDLAGVVEAVGPGVTDLAVGDEVLGAAPGAFAELTVARADRLVRRPTELSWEMAGMLAVAGCTALLAVRDHGGIGASDAAGSGGPEGSGAIEGRGASPGSGAARPRVLIVGAGGGVGSLAVGIARQLGAEVTAATRAASVDAVRGLGADRVLDHGREEVLVGADRYEAIVDLGGTRPVGAYRRILAPGGRYVIVGGPSGRWFRPLDRMIAARLTSLRGPERFIAFLAGVRAADLALLAEWAASGAIRPLIDRVVPLEGVAEAIGAAERGEVRGKVGVRLLGDGAP